MSVHLTTRLTAIFLEDRVGPVRSGYAETLRDVCAVYPDGPLIGHYSVNAKDTFAQLRRGIEIPSYLPTLTCPDCARRGWRRCSRMTCASASS